VKKKTTIDSGRQRKKINGRKLENQEIPEKPCLERRCQKTLDVVVKNCADRNLKKSS
jgi:hypothetical protein